MREGFKKVRLYILGVLSLIVSLRILWSGVYPYSLDHLIPDKLLVLIVVYFSLLALAVMLPIFLVALYFRSDFRKWCLESSKGILVVIPFLIPPILSHLVLQSDALFNLVYTNYSNSLEAARDKNPDALKGKRFGPWKIIEAREDLRGGLYLVTHKGNAMIDTVSYGFAYQPNQEGSPFGNAYYEIEPLGDGWYTFAANNDW